MFNIKEYLQKGIIENYCLGLCDAREIDELMQLRATHPAIKSHLEKTQKGMEAFLKSYQRKPSKRSKNLIKDSILENEKLNMLSLQGKDQMLMEFINISRHTDIVKFEQITGDVKPPAKYDNIYIKPLFLSKEQELILMWAKQLAPNEIHPDIDESFLVLEGTMDCIVEGEVFQMERGDFMRIPPNASHHVVITSLIPAKAIRSRVLLA